MKVAQTALFSMTLTVSRSTVEVFHTMALNWDLSNIFLMIHLELQLFLKEGDDRGYMLFALHAVRHICC